MNGDGRDDAVARTRFMIINIIRLSGMAMVLLALAVYYRKIDMPVEVAYVLAPLGIAEFFVVPQILSRMWRSSDW